MAFSFNPFTGNLDLIGGGDTSSVDALVDLSGVPEGSTDLGTFTGTIIPDNSDNKQALQALETAIEAVDFPVDSVFGRTGDVVAEDGDYTAAQITNVPAGTISAITVQAAITELDSEKFASADFNSTFDTQFATKSTTDLLEGSNLYFTDERVDDRVSNLIVAGTGITSTYDDVANTLTIASTITQYTDELAQDAVGTILIDSSSIDFTYTDATPSISAVVLPAGVDHDSLQNFVANEHIDHSTVSISAGTGLTGGGDITTSRTISMPDVGTPGTYGSASSVSVVTTDTQGRVSSAVSTTIAITASQVTDFNQAAKNATGSAGDIYETSFSAANNQSSVANVTGLAFAAASVRSFVALISVEIDATSDLYEEFTLNGINKVGSFEMSQDSVGDTSGIVFSITSAGQVQYTSTNVAGFVTNTIRFRAITTNF
jgi:hypothetical protein